MAARNDLAISSARNYLLAAQADQVACEHERDRKKAALDQAIKEYADAEYMVGFSRNTAITALMKLEALKTAGMCGSLGCWDATVSGGMGYCGPHAHKDFPDAITQPVPVSQP